jgi:hypothetical protein
MESRPKESPDKNWLVVPYLKANQTDEGQPSENEPTQSGNHYDKK